MSTHENAIKHYQDRFKYNFKYLHDVYYDRQNHPELFSTDMVYICRGHGFKCDHRDFYSKKYYDTNGDPIKEGFTLDIKSDSMIFQLPNGNFKLFLVHEYIENYGDIGIGMGFKPRIPTTKFIQSREYRADELGFTDDIEKLDTSFEKRGDPIYSNSEIRYR